MATVLSHNHGNSSAEEKFVELFCDTFGAEKGQFVYLQHPFVDIYGNHRTIDFAIKTDEGTAGFSSLWEEILSLPSFTRKCYLEW